MSGTWDWERCTSNCLSYTVASPGFYDELSCIASGFYCMCREVLWNERLVNGDVTSLACISENGAEPAKIGFTMNSRYVHVHVSTVYEPNGSIHIRVCSHNFLDAYDYTTLD
ncbi:hypothetical protein GT037_001886 [Alternaria burnsii]|uniref:Uncharacterized protein n=1 Tax=Alternaria burnsii TaxID=1187904 RepID=A0A8H7EHJ7_9PLEO|nr:uncharacterized protein GT037_001886 [Alternaria burnsii]KAF7680235.1 hypothetical protein GT037_001886 [Alternaria burnsii]